MQTVSVSGDPRPESLSLVTKITVNVFRGPSSISLTSASESRKEYKQNLKPLLCNVSCAEMYIFVLIDRYTRSTNIIVRNWIKVTRVVLPTSFKI